MYKLSRFSRNIINNEQIILCNTSTGSYIKTKKKAATNDVFKT